MKARYIRISTSNQNLERQLTNKKDEEIFIDIVSGATPFNKRVKGNQLLKQIEENNIKYVSVHSIDRLGRNLFDILSTLEIFENKGVALKVDNLGIESIVAGKPNFAFKLIISVMANIAEMERETLLERQKEGIIIAKTKGVYKGRLKGTKETKSLFLSKHKEVVKYINQNHSLRNVAKLCNLSLGTVQKVKKNMSNQNDL